MAIKKENKTKKHIAVLEYVFLSFALIIFWILKSPKFPTNDDYGLLSILAGYKTGTPIAVPFYCEYLYALLISVLYKISGSFPWYMLMFMALVLTSSLCLYYAINKVVKDSGIKKNNKIIVLFMFFSLITGIYLFNFVYITFSIVPAVCGCSAVLLILTMNKEDTAITSSVVTGIIFVLFFFAWNIRIESGYISFISALLAITYAMFNKNIKKRRGILLFIGVIAIAAISFFADWYSGTFHGWNEFKLYYDACGQYTDYTHLTYEEAPDLYQSIGWNENLYHLVNNWFFMDERVDYNAFNTLNNAVEKHSFYGYSSRRALLFGMFNIFKNSSLWIRIFFIVFGISVLAISVCRIVNVNKKHSFKDVCGMGLFLLLGLAFIAYLLMRGRFLDRAVYPVVFCTMVPGLVLCLRTVLNMIVLKKGKEPADNKRDISLIIACASLAVSCSIVAVMGAKSANWNKYNPDAVQTKLNLEKYVMDNDEYFYIYNTSLIVTGDPFTVYPDQKPTNYTFWGGTFLKSPSYYDQIKRYGFEELSRSAFISDKVRFISRSGPEDIFLDYMQEEYPDCRVEIVDYSGEFIIYRYLEN